MSSSCNENLFRTKIYTVQQRLQYHGKRHYSKRKLKLNETLDRKDAIETNQESERSASRLIRRAALPRCKATASLWKKCLIAIASFFPHRRALSLSLVLI